MEIQMVPLPHHSSMGDAFIDSDGMVDAAGNRFSLLAEAQAGNGNITFATLRKFAPDGTVLGTWVFRPVANQKIDKANLARSGQDVIVECVTHAITSVKPRQLHKETGVIAGVFVTTTSFEAEESGEGAFVPTGEQEGEVDYERIERIVKFIVDTEVKPFVEQWARTTIANIIPKTQNAFAQGLDENNSNQHAVAFRDALFPYLKNAAANPLANVLGAQDAWGQARQDELKDIIREANGTPGAIPPPGDTEPEP